MRITFKKSFLALLLASVAIPGFADNLPKENVALPMADCSVAGVCIFSHLQDYTQGGKAAYFYCVPNPDSTTIKMENHAVLITGFDKGGHFIGTPDDLNKYYFAAYIDPDKANDPHLLFAVDQSKNIQCYPASPDLGNRVLNPNPPGLQHLQK